MKPATKPASQRKLAAASNQAFLRRSDRFRPLEKLKQEIYCPKSTICRKSADVRIGSGGSSELKDAAPLIKNRGGICETNQAKMWDYKPGMVLEENKSCPRRSPRLLSNNRIKDFEILPGLPELKSRRFSTRVHGAAHVSAVIVKEQNPNPRIINETEFMKPLKIKTVDTRPSVELLAVPTRFKQELYESATIAKQILEKSSPQIGNPLDGVMGKIATVTMIGKRLVAGVEGGSEKEKATAFQKKMRKIKEEEEEAKNGIEETKIKECNSSVIWSNEQEEALQKAFLVAKPSPHFWKKVSRLVPEKSAQECFDKIHASMATPLPHQPKLRTKRKSPSQIAEFDPTANISHLFGKDAGKFRRCRTSRLAVQKVARHLLRMHCLADRRRVTDRFSLLESSPVSISVDILSTESSQLPETSRLPGESMPDNMKKMLSRPESPSPQVLKAVKNRVLHDRYINQLHHRETRRAVLAKRSNFGNGVKIERGSLKTVRSALVSDARSFISHFQSVMADCRHEYEEDESDEYEDEILC